MNLIEEIDKLKLEGNKFFNEGKYAEAIDYYSSAIGLTEKLSLENKPSEKNKIAILFSNRANTYLNLFKYEESLKDSEISILYNPDWFKGYFRKAKALYGLNNFIEAKSFFKKAYKLAKSEEEKREIKLVFKNLQIKKKKNIIQPIEIDDSNPIFNEDGIFSDANENESESVNEVQDQVDFLMSQFIKPYEEDAFRSLSVYHGIEDGKLDKENARIWIKFAGEYGCGDSPELLEALIKYVGLVEEKDIEKEFNRIYEFCGVLV
jgi:tetratricopeptide (TPR) repeat protein